MSLLNNPACGLRPTNTDAATKWCRDYSNVLELADYLVHENELTSAHLVLEFFSKPWKWSAEWEAYQRSTNVMEDAGDAVRALPPTDKITPLPWRHQSV